MGPGREATGPGREEMGSGREDMGPGLVPIDPCPVGAYLGDAAYPPTPYLCLLKPASPRVPKAMPNHLAPAFLCFWWCPCSVFMLVGSNLAKRSVSAPVHATTVRTIFGDAMALFQTLMRVSNSNAVVFLCLRKQKRGWRLQLWGGARPITLPAGVSFRLIWELLC